LGVSCSSAGKETQFSAAGLLHEQIRQRATWPAAARQFLGESCVATFNDPQPGAGKLIAAPQARMDRFGQHNRAHGFPHLKHCIKKQYSR
jgi:hypothetical protein